MRSSKVSREGGTTNIVTRLPAVGSGGDATHMRSPAIRRRSPGEREALTRFARATIVRADRGNLPPQTRLRVRDESSGERRAGCGLRARGAPVARRRLSLRALVGAQ